MRRMAGRGINHLKLNETCRSAKKGGARGAPLEPSGVLEDAGAAVGSSDQMAEAGEEFAAHAEMLGP